MSNRKILVLLSLKILFFFNLLEANENKIIAIVNNEPITSYELKNKIFTQIYLANETINQEIIDKTKNSALSYLINLKIKKKEVEKKKIKADKPNIDSALKKISSNNVLLFKKQFQENSLDYDLFLKEVEIELSWQKLIYNLYKDKVKINDNEVKNELNLIRRNGSETEYKLSEIEIEITEENKNDRINEVVKVIKNSGFENAARKLSISSSARNGGDLGWISSSALSKSVLDLLLKININEITTPIIKFDSVLFLKINDKKKTNINATDLDALKKKIINQKTNDLFKLYSNNHLSKIKNNAFIKIK